MKQMTEELEEVSAPLYAWRAFRVEQITSDYETRWVLSPLFFRGMHRGLPAHTATHLVTQITFDLIDWNESPCPPDFDNDFFGAMYGFHTFRLKPDAETYLYKTLTATRSITDVVLAKVELGGIVVEHEKGYRSEKIRIVELHHPNGDPKVRQNLGVALGWPFEIHPADPQLLPGSKVPTVDHDEIKLAAQVLARAVTYEDLSRDRLYPLVRRMEHELRFNEEHKGAEKIIHSAGFFPAVTSSAEIYRRMLKELDGKMEGVKKSD